LNFADSAPVPDESKRALVVDDDDAIRSMLAKVVARIGIPVDTARDGIEAVERIDAGPYDVIVLDLMMPRLDGYGVLRHIRENHPELLDCTIIASAVPETEILRRFDGATFKVHPKPFDLNVLIEDIRKCVNRAGQPAV
jgi:CheY-like chemotaxis protein